MNAIKLAISLFVAALAYGPTQGWAVPILGTAGDFAVLGGSTVTNTGATTLTGLLGVSTGTAITGQETITINGAPALGAGAGSVHATDAVAAQAQADLTTVYLGLQGLLAPAANDLSGQNLGNRTLTPGVYSFATDAQLTGTLILNALGLENALFVFQIGTNLNTEGGPAGSAVQIINPGSNNGVFWVVGSATIGTFTEFQGNILGYSGITLKTSATIGCGRALNQIPGPVNMDTNTISIGCAGNGLSGGGTIEIGQGGVPRVIPLPGAFAPEPGTLLLLGFGLAGLFASRKRLFPVA